ncbi:MAG TPA: SUMF1/EgtB/PvdO family nonheme iron enzyme [Polyangiaceae bacterium]
MKRQPFRIGALCLIFGVVACWRGKDGGSRDAAPSVAGSASAGTFVWPLGGSSDAGEHATPRKGMIWIPGGTLVAGTPKERTPRLADEELPGQAIELSGFYVDEFAYPNEVGAIPKTGMTRDEAAGLCAGQGKRLCTELEWERACKGPANTTYEYGESYRAAECATGMSGRLAPSGLRVACKSAFGVHDMHGGPWEWTASSWRRGGDSQAGTLRGGNSDTGELVGRCANAVATAPSTRRPDVAVRCCAGDPNLAEVRLEVARGKTLAVRYAEPQLVATLAQAVQEKTLPDLPPEQPFRIDRVWLWHPIGNEELVLAAGCARQPPHLACGVGVFRMRPSGTEEGAAPAPALVSFASSGWWMAVVRTDHRTHDLWVYGGDGRSSFRRRVAYVWGRVVLGEAERTKASDLLE